MGGLRLFSYGTLITGGLSSQVDEMIAQHCRTHVGNTGAGAMPQ